MTNRALLALCAALIAACGTREEPGGASAPADIERPTGVVW
jgi:hypothetical protein